MKDTKAPSGQERSSTGIVPQRDPARQRKLFSVGVNACG